MIRKGDPIWLGFDKKTGQVSRKDGKVRTYESREQGEKYLCMDFIEMVEYVPAPVRCKDCRHSDWAGNSPYCLLHGCYIDEDGFCSDGEEEVDHATD